MNKHEAEVSVMIGATLLLLSAFINVVLWDIQPASLLIAATGLTVGFTGLLYINQKETLK